MLIINILILLGNTAFLVYSVTHGWTGYAAIDGILVGFYLNLVITGVRNAGHP